MNGMEEYKFVGAQWGKFTPEGESRSRAYCNIFVLRHFAGNETNDRCFIGNRAEKLKCLDPGVFSGIEPGKTVNIWFDQYGRVSRMEVINTK